MMHSMALLRRSVRATKTPLQALTQQLSAAQCAVPAITAPFLVLHQPIAGVRTKMSERAMRRKNLRKMKNNVSQVPLLKDTLRKLYLRTHPDLFGQYPEQQQQNDASYKELMGILDSIEKHNEFPPAKSLVLPFYLKTPIDGQFKQVALRMRTTGGACNTLVEEALGVFFTECGLPGVFRWSEGSWGKAVGKDAVQNSNLGFDEEDSADKKRREAAEVAEEDAKYSAPAYNPVDRAQPEDTSIERVLNELNDVFEIIAAVPWMDEEEYGELRRHYEQENGLLEIEARGFTIKDATERIWQGERDMNTLVTGLDADSALIVQRILMHTFNIEQKIREHLAAEAEAEENKPSN
ncbi:hypothetical protein Poli38472_003109 [Pythium oligandrum]|uniref:DUF4460 domain-containing protein n=1 Tax=Pythium oligandrum TaxID=41045 RepID=A0A8K1C668_PYTOL|nr:hypothetical protein Poli38472_003109 [Pythium oligandrum]|eukprot:TMW57184.1 hypothetical protein Poli38472_003109 [Pythium oligandrum]